MFSMYYTFLLFTNCFYSILSIYLDIFIWKWSSLEKRHQISFVTFVKSQTRNVSQKVRSAYLGYFWRALTQDKPWFFSVSCYTTISCSYLGSMETRRQCLLPYQFYGVNLSIHFNDCYYCMSVISGFKKKSKHNIRYVDVPSLLKPVPHRKECLLLYTLSKKK